MKRTYKTYETFDEVNVPFLKAYNRFVTASNVHADLGEEQAEEYMKQFAEADIVMLKVLSKAIQGLGMGEVKRQAMELMNKEAKGGDGA